MTKIEQGTTPAGLPEGGRSGLPYLGSGSEVGAAALQEFRQAGMVDESNPAERGGGDVDPVEEYFVRNQAVFDKMGEYIEAQKKAGKKDDELVNLDGQPLCTFGEYQKIYEAIQAARVKGGRRAVEEIIREARQPAEPAPEPRFEPQPTPRLADWIGELPVAQRDWVSNFLSRLSGDRQIVLQGLQLLIETIDSGGVVPREISSWPGGKIELRKTIAKIGEDFRHKVALEKAAGDSEMKQDDEGTMVALRFVGDFKIELQRQYPNNLKEQRKAMLNLRSRLRKLDALGLSPDDDLIPPGIDIGVLLQYLRPKDIEEVNGGV